MNVVRLRLALTAFLLLSTSPSLADDVLGTWSRDNGAVHVKIDPCGDAICGNIAWLEPARIRKPKSGSVCSSTCVPMVQSHGPAKRSILTMGQSIQAKCLLKDLPSAPRTASSAD
jgi:uncharacterized protein (DUF2147 family)